MIRYELLRILRSGKWKYMVFSAIIVYLYAVSMYSTAFMNGTQAGSMFPLTPEQRIQSAAVMGTFAYLFVFYLIAWDEEPPLSWRTPLANPQTCRRAYLCKLAAVLLFQIPATAIAIALYTMVKKSITTEFLSFLLCIQLLYLTGFLYGCYKTSQGYMAAMGSITIINVTKRLVPIFLVFCILNAGDWSGAFAGIWPIVVLFCLCVIGGILFWLPECMKRKLHREMVLSRLFQNLKYTPGQLMMMQYQKRADRFIQFLFRKFDTHSASYWQRCAVIEVSIKLHFFSFAFLILFLIWFFVKLNLLLLLVALAFLLHVLYCIRLESRTIHAVYIRDGKTIRGKNRSK